MLQHTFCHLPGIGKKREQQLWSDGIATWTQALSSKTPSFLRSKSVQEGLQLSQQRLSEGDVKYFNEVLPQSCRWRMFKEFQKLAIFVDIETTGLHGSSDYITAIGLYKGNTIRQFIHDFNVNEFTKEIDSSCLIVTYNGNNFDLPFIRSELSMPMDQAHIDLKSVLTYLGYTGGLKKCEQKLGVKRENLEQIDGLFAMGLWLDYLRGNKKALETLLAYNAVDTINLEELMIKTYNKAISFTPFSGENSVGFVSKDRPVLPFPVDQETIRRLKRRYSC